MINLISQEAFAQQMQKIKNSIVSFKERMGKNLTDINTELTAKGSTQADDYSEVPAKIEAISTGITPTGTISITANGSYDVTDYASASVDVPNDDSELVALCQGTLTSIDNDNVTSLRSRLFQQNDGIKRAVFKNCALVRGDAFTNCNYFQYFETSVACNFASWCFSYASSFKTLILRATTISTLSNVSAFANTPLRNGTGGTVYVPYALKSSYEAETNWSALESTTFAAIQENLVALNTLGVDITDYYEIVTALPSSDISTTKVYFIETQTTGTFEQWFYGSGAWVQSSDITLGVAE